MIIQRPQLKCRIKKPGPILLRKIHQSANKPKPKPNPQKPENKNAQKPKEQSKVRSNALKSLMQEIDNDKNIDIGEITQTAMIKEGTQVNNMAQKVITAKTPISVF